MPQNTMPQWLKKQIRQAFQKKDSRQIRNLNDCWFEYKQKERQKEREKEEHQKENYKKHQREEKTGDHSASSYN